MERAVGLHFLPGISHRCPPPARAWRVALALLALVTLGFAHARTTATAAPSSAGPRATPAGFPSPAMMVPPLPHRAKEFAFLYDSTGLFHIFYMRHHRTLPDDSTELDIGHAVSTDLRNWTQLDSVLRVQPGTWDSSHVWAPTIIKRGDTWYMFYAGVQNQPFAWNWFQRVGVATSTDLMNWTHYDEPVYTGNHVPWAFADSSQFEGSQFRDPFVMEDPENPGGWIMYFVTVPSAARGQLLVGAARNDGGLAPWRDAGVLWCTDAAHYWGWCESPLVFRHADTWFLFITQPNLHPIGFRTAPSPLADSTLWSGTYRLYDYADRWMRNSDAWFGAEFLSVGGHDYFAYVDSDSNGIGIEELMWGAQPDSFRLVTPSVVGVGRSSLAPPSVGLRLVGRASRRSGALLAVNLPEAVEARLEIFDVAGRRVRTLRPGTLSAGESLVRWDARGEAGVGLANAMFFARVSTASGSRVVRVPLLD